jgi:hypothetical protein
MSPIPEASRLQLVAAGTAEESPRLASLADTFNENVVKLNARMFTCMDYAAVGRK